MSPNLIAIVPAAGRGSRLGSSVPKALVMPDGQTTLLEMAYSKLKPFVTEVVAIVNPEMLENPNLPKLEHLEYLVQDSPTGMGDAVMLASDYIIKSDGIIVLWADQYGITSRTVQKSVSAFYQKENFKARVILPLIKVEQPYVEYVFGSDSKLEKVLQSREGDVPSLQGLTDVGLFLMTGGLNLVNEWVKHVSQTPTGSKTGERNFLPFLAWLSIHGWDVQRTECVAEDRRGINTAEELKYAESQFKKR